MRKNILLLPLLFLLSHPVSAQIINASTCSSTDVQTAFNSVVASTTTVNIPAGTCHWSTQVTLNVPAGSTNLSVLGAGNLSTPGGGDATVIIDDDATDTNSLLILVSGVASSHFRFAGVTIQIGSGSLKSAGLLQFLGYSQNFRFDHSHLNEGPYFPLRIYGWIYGVADHNIIEASGAISDTMDPYNNPGGNTNTNYFGDGSWADATNFGGSNYFFLEDNVFNSNSPSGQSSSYMNDCVDGGRMVIRHNVMNGVGVETHATGSEVNDNRGCRSTEIYDNTFNGAISPTTETYTVFYMTSGTGLVWGNTASGYESFIQLHSTRRDNTTYTMTPTPNGWGYCGTSFNGTGSAWDQNLNTSTGYRCLDEPGTGKSDLLNGNVPNKVDVVTGTLTWPNQALEPIYEWLNNYTPSSGYSSSTVINGISTALTANQDFYQYTGSFTGSTGAGSGLLSARPATCRVQVGYWATDTNTLYLCKTTNTWTSYYTPYTYPHPLVTGGGGGGGGGGGASPPTNVSIIVVF